MEKQKLRNALHLLDAYEAAVEDEDPRGKKDRERIAKLLTKVLNEASMQAKTMRVKKGRVTAKVPVRVRQLGRCPQCKNLIAPGVELERFRCGGCSAALLLGSRAWRLLRAEKGPL